MILCLVNKSGAIEIEHCQYLERFSCFKNNYENRECLFSTPLQKSQFYYFNAELYGGIDL